MNTGERIRDVLPYLDQEQIKQLCVNMSYMFDIEDREDGSTPFYFDMPYPKGYVADRGLDVHYWRQISPLQYTCTLSEDWTLTINMGEQSEECGIKPGDRFVCGVLRNLEK